MFKVKQKIATLLAAFLTAIFAIVLAFGTMTATPKTTAKAADASYVKATSIDDGNYLIVYVDKQSGYVFTGIDAANNNVSATIDSNGILTSTNDLSLYAVTITKMTGGYSIKINNGTNKGKYTYGTSGSNKINFGSDPQANSIEIQSDGSAKITSKTSVFRYNPSSGNNRFRYFKSSTYTDQKPVYLYKLEEAGCAHVEGEPVIVEPTCTEAGSKTINCSICGEQMSTEEISAKGHTEGELSYTDNKNGTHTVKSVCTVEGCNTEFTVNKAEQCNVKAAYVREGDMHTQTGTCTLCGASTSVTEDCTIDDSKTTYAQCATDNQSEQKHNKTTYCEVCKQYDIVEEACSFDDGVLDGTTLTFTCEHCAYSYSKTVATYTVTYSTPNGEKTETVIENESPKFEALDGYDGKTFVGWVTEKVDPATENKPETIYTDGSTYKITKDGVVFYALYSYTDGVEGWNLVTDVNQLTVGSQIVITDKDGTYALSTNQRTSNRGAVKFDASNLSDDVQKITLELGYDDQGFAFNVGPKYLYAASSTSNHLKTQENITVNSTWAITINNGIASIVASASSNNNVMQFNPNNGTPIFACYASASQTALSIYSYSTATTYYVTPSKVCEHANTYEEILEEATCTKVGYKQFYCEECDAPVGEPIEIPMIDHDFENGECTRCGEDDPAIDYSGYYYIAFTQDGNLLYVNNTTWKSNRYTAEQFDASSFNVNYIFQLVKVGTGLYKITEWDGDNIAAYDGNVTVERVGDVFYFKNADDNYLSLNHSDTYDYVRFYSSSFSKDITLTPVALASFDEASVTVGTDIKVNYYVTLPEAIAESVVFNYKIGDSADIYEAKGTLVGTQYKFSLAIGPHLMTETLTAWISLDSTTLASHNTLSIRSYAQELLNNAEYTAELKQLVSDMLRYGEAAQKYQNHKVDDPATAVDGILTASAAEPTESYSLVKNPDATEFPVFFKGASVWFGDVNRIRVSFKLADGVAFEDLENVTLTIGENTVVLTSIDYTYVTEGILATELDKEFTFVLSCNGVELQTLTYSVNAYATQMKSNQNMRELAFALYRYGESAKNYQTSLIA